MQKEPLLILFISLICGIFLQDFFNFTTSQIYLFLIVCLLLLAFSHLSKSFLIFKFRPFFTGLFISALGIFFHFLHSQKPLLPELGTKEILNFKISKKLNSNEKNRRYEITAWKGDIAFQSVISIPKSNPELNYLHYYQGDLYINKVQKSYSDYQFDYQKYLSRKGIYFQSYLTSELKIANRNDLSFSEKIKQQRLDLLVKVDQSALRKRTREFVKGIILADRTEMDQETVRDFRDSGMMHILAISGTHVAIIFGLILLILNFIFPPKFKMQKIIVALILIWSFAIFIDFGNSVVRSCLMITTYYMFVLLQRKTDLLHSLSLAGFIILLLNSNQVFEVGFQLSFAAVFGIFWFNQPLLKYLPSPKNKFQNFMANILSISLSAQLATLPLVVFYFHQYSAISIIANLVIIPFAEIIIILSLVMVVLFSLSISFSALNFFFDSVITKTLELIHFFGNLDFAMSRLIPMTILEVVMLYIILYFLKFPLKNFKIKNGLNLFYAVALFVLLRVFLNYSADHYDEVLVHQIFKEKVISVKNGKDIIFYVSEKTDQNKLQQYIIDPYLSSRRTKIFSVKIVSANVSQIKVGEKLFHF